MLNHGPYRTLGASLCCLLIFATAFPGSDPAWRYLPLGMAHILLGPDHLLFLLALALLVPERRRLLLAVTAFALAHSLTLALTALGVVPIPEPPVEAGIALSIVILALELRRSQQGHLGLVVSSPWLAAFAFGLVHGLGFGAALGDLGLPHGAEGRALVAFNLGVEGGQLAFVLAVLGAWQPLRKARLPRWTAALPAYGMGALGLYWLGQRLLVMVA
ncbi:HupE/UreJ family protein [Gallaecimonas kandeliae]|uniref:HupE/UreJ family protein n=1 Tax=Gallaecimonas kandeliae TaxID=3029055 RepID=UPI00264701BC|nr:HupE/UreJ family protein [Gallaecimonas kandeliae]WKE64317.1 HupE/UreJ family protein [Gallaecimonas kandeliae]